MFGRNADPVSNLRLGLCVLALLAASLAPAFARCDIDNTGASATVDVPAAFNGNGKATFAIKSYLFFPDGYPGGRSLANLGPGIVVDSSVGPYTVDSANQIHTGFDLNGPAYKTFGPGKFCFGAVYAGQQSDGSDAVDEGISNLINTTPTIGTCVCQVVTPDPSKPGSFLPLPGASIQFCQVYSDNEAIDGRNYPTGTTIVSRGATNCAYLVFGNDPSGAQRTDCSFPSGRAAANFAFFAHKDGYKDIENDAQGNGLQGSAWPGHGCVITLVPNSSSAKSSLSVVSGDPTGGTGAWDGTGTPPTPPSSTTTPGTGTGDDTSSGFFSGFWDKLKAFFSDMFTLQQADVDDLGAVKDKFVSYGPLGLPVSIKREFDNAFLNQKGADGSDPHYWDFPLTLTLGYAGRFGSAYPAGYDPDKAYHPPPAPTVFVTSLFPDYFDLSPYSDYVLRGRFIALWGLWLFVVYQLIRRFGPTLNI